MKVLNIAEKPSVAKSISLVLSKSCRFVSSSYKYCPNIHFRHSYNGQDCEFVFTSVLGHIFTTDFLNQGRWEDIDPESLFEEKIVKFVKDDFLRLKENLEKNVSRAGLVIIWTDCDREGENIARQISEIAQTVKNIEVRRARFFGISKREIDAAICNLSTINQAEADAVDARMELDLRIGSSFTRLQTLSLRSKTKLDMRVVSYGSCQIPTLGFVVERSRQIENFVKEAFWSLSVLVDRRGVCNTFSWERSNIFDKNCVLHFFEKIQGIPAKVVSKEEIPKEKMRPLPLRTVDMQKFCSSYFKLSAHKIMERAESLYNKGYISYPRTETDSFGKNFKFQQILSELENDAKVGKFAAELQGSFKHPRAGKNNDMAHLPIYPLKHGNGLAGDDAKIFEFVARRFLACLCENAKGVETKVILGIGGESFKLDGLKISERNYLDIYFYDKWECKEISEFRANEILTGYEMNVTEGSTTPPEQLTEADLINLMDKNGIGTDATIHEHIQKIQDRGYAKKIKTRLVPQELGCALIEGYEIFGLNFSKPKLRSELEQSLRKVEKGETTRDEVVRSQLHVYRTMYRMMRDRIDEFTSIFDRIQHISPANTSTRPHNVQGGSDGDNREKLHHAGNTSVEGYTSFRKSSRGSRSKILASGSAERVEIVQKAAKENRDNEISGLVKKIRNKSMKVQCKCRIEAKACKIAKKNENEGRTFYGCGMFPRKCDMFVWEEDMESHNQQSREDESTGVNCHCGYETKQLVARSGSNKGKPYLKCKKLYKPCNFFMWKSD